MSNVKAFILAAGNGTRLKPITEFVPKCLVPVGGRPLMDHWIDKLVRAGVESALVNTHSHIKIMDTYLDRVGLSGLKITRAYEPHLLGSAGTLSMNRQFAADADHILVIYGDNYSEVDLGKMIEFHIRHAAPVTMLVFECDSPKECGIVELNNGIVTHMEEKPRNPMSTLANGGILLFTKQAFDAIKVVTLGDLSSCILPQFIPGIRAYQPDVYHQDIGVIERLYEADKVAEKVNYTCPVNSRAVFMDRDDTLIKDTGYMNDASSIQPVPGAVEAVKSLRNAGFKIIIATNQSGIARKLVTLEQMHCIHARMQEMFDDCIHAFYWNEVIPGTDDQTLMEHWERKPGPGMLLRASIEVGIDLRHSYMVGDKVSDIHCGRYAGCKHQFLVSSDDVTLPENCTQAPDISKVAAAILESNAK